MLSQNQVKVADESRIKMIKSSENSAVVKIGDQKFVDFSGSCFDKEWIEKQTSDLVLKNTMLYQKYYLGSITKEKAIEACVKKCEWHIFHAIDNPISDSDDLQLQSASPLFVVYRRNDNGQHELYPIQSKATENPMEPVYYVDYGDPEAPLFANIFALLKYYDNFEYLFIADSGDCYNEVFPHWLCLPPIDDDSDLSSPSTSYANYDLSMPSSWASASVGDSALSGMDSSSIEYGDILTAHSFSGVSITESTGLGSSLKAYSELSTALESSMDGETDSELAF